ncbi:uncharacterized protein N7529_002535 [Penicillium soppii]|uniref:uncharacterized protein n=1 Tax=Penicillium soppii TaxID=69789 RepID=UPI002546E8A9|nr:uncharacterized protein N7529_002535 [Penicillium soppii]KAJ5874105.1 hypothetical protein N7529_002535 [Penicillium soppii]
MESKEPVSTDSNDRDHLVMYSNPVQNHDEDTPWATLPPCLAELRAFPDGKEVHSELLRLFKDTFGAEPHMVSPTSYVDAKRTLNLEDLPQNEDKIKVFEHVLGINDPCVELTRRFMDQWEEKFVVWDKLEFNILIGEIQWFLSNKNLEEAEKKVKNAMEVAMRIGDEITKARVFFWRGFIEYRRNNIPTAHRYFEAARPCAADKRRRWESLDIEFLLDNTRPGINYETRAARHRAWIDLGIQNKLPYDADLINSIRVDGKETRKVQTLTDTKNFMRVEDSEIRKVVTPTKGPFPPATVPIGPIFRPILAIRQRRKAAPQATVSGDSSTHAGSQKEQKKNMNSLGEILEELLAEEFGNGMSQEENEKATSQLGKILAEVLEEENGSGKAPQQVPFKPAQHSNPRPLSDVFFFGATHEGAPPL